MKSVLISIQPRWCELIASGKKTVEVRKIKPKLETPFKCYIYETNWKDNTYWKNYHKGRLGKVIGEFVCDSIVQFENSIYDEAFIETRKSSCVPLGELLVYIGCNDYGYGWHISDLVIYDKPRLLGEFKKTCNHKNDCCTCDRYDYIGHRCYDEITRPPQSWCYVESAGEK